MVVLPPGRRAAGPGTVAQDLLLLAVGERSRYLTRGPVSVVVAAGSVVDELLAGTPLDAVAADRRALARHLGEHADARMTATTQALLTAGAVEPSRTRVLGLFPRDGLHVLDQARAQGARARLLGALRPGAVPTPPDAALAAVAAVGGLARVHAPVHGGQERRSLAQQVNSLAAVMGPDPSEVVSALRQALGRLDGGEAGTVLVVPDSDPDGYGDCGGDGDSGGGGDGGGDGGGGD